jgi:subtilisin family serine protease
VIRGWLWRLVAAAFALIGASSFTPATAANRPPPNVDRQILVMLRLAPEHFHTNGNYSGGGYGDATARSGRERMARGIARKYGLTLVDDWPMPMIGVDCYVMAVPDGRSTSAAAEQVSHDSDVSWAEPVALYTSRGEAAPGENDPLFRAEPAAAEWHLADLHRIADGRGARVAVIDSGIDSSHPDLSGQVTINRNFVSGQQLIAEQHGTAVAGIIAAKADNRIGIAGVAPGARLLGLRACWQQRGSAVTVCDTLSLAKALVFAVESHADIVNLSLSGPETRLLSSLVGVALSRGLTVVAAFDPARPDGGFPASVPGVIRVTDSQATAAHGNVYFAPGRDIPTTEPGGRWFLVNGSSFSAAHVSGLVALMHERGRTPALTLVASRRGGGVIDACATLIRVVGACDCACGGGHYAAGAGRR